MSINFVPTVEEDLPLIKTWIDADPWHPYKSAERWWLTAAIGSFIAFKLVDELGTVVFVRFDKEGNLIRMHGQFAPADQVSEKRVAKALLESIPRFILEIKTRGIIGIITESVSPRLVAFLCNRLGFKLVVNDDYKLIFGEER